MSALGALACVVVLGACSESDGNQPSRAADDGGGDAGMGGEGDAGAASLFPLEGSLSAVTATEAGFAAVGLAGGPLVLTVDAGGEWVRQTLPTAEGSLLDVAFGGDTLVAVGGGGSANSHILTRGHGSWLRQLIGTNNQGVLFGNGTFLSTASVEPGARVSNDGVAWTQVEIAGSFLGFDGTRFVALTSVFDDLGTTTVSRQVFQTSETGTEWDEPVDVQVDLRQLLLAPAGEQILGIARSCVTRACTDSDPWVQLVGERGTPPWELEVTPAPRAEAPVAIAAGGGNVVVAYPSFVLWTQLPIVSDRWNVSDLSDRGWTIADVAYGNGTFVVVGTRASEVLIATSSYGGDWVDVSRAPDACSRIRGKSFYSVDEFSDPSSGTYSLRVDFHGDATFTWWQSDFYSGGDYACDGDRILTTFAGRESIEAEIVSTNEILWAGSVYTTEPPEPSLDPDADAGP